MLNAVGLTARSLVNPPPPPPPPPAQAAPVAGAASAPSRTLVDMASGSAAQASSREAALSPVDRKAAATDRAVASYAAAQSGFFSVAAQPLPNPAALQILGDQASQAQTALKAATADELNARAQQGSGPGQAPTELDYASAGAAIAARYAGQDAAQSWVQSAVLDAMALRGPIQDAPRDVPAASTVTQSGDQVIVETTNADDVVKVDQDAKSGEVTVTVNGKAHTYSAEEAQRITIRTNGGNDTINVSPNVKANVRAEGGDGNDTLVGGAGNDSLDGGAGNDRIVGGQGKDTMVGGTGNDRVSDDVGFLSDLDLIAKGIAPRTGGGDDFISGGDGDDRIDAGAGKDTVLGGEGDDQIDAGAGDDLVAGGAGDDQIDAGTGDDRVYGQDGDDRIQAGEGDDVVDAGAGDDYVDGFTGNDRLQGGDGADTLYAGEGDDTVDGGAGDDYLDGYLGNDRMSGGEGKDVLSGGQGEDTLAGGAGDDVIYTGKGKDRVDDSDGKNTVYHQQEDSLKVNDATLANPNTRVVEVADVPDNIKVEGSPEFQARMRADLETLAASPTGQQMLEDIGKQRDGWGIFGRANTLTITELNEENGKGGGTFGGDGFAQINPAFHLDDDDGRAPPISVLYHELAHARAAMSDNWAPGQFNDGSNPSHPDNGIDNAERQATGLPIDHDQDPSTPPIKDPNTPPAMTENAIRDEMGYPLREDYR